MHNLKIIPERLRLRLFLTDKKSSAGNLAKCLKLTHILGTMLNFESAA